MHDSRTRSFGELFGSGWSAFKNNYGLCLGISMIFIIIYMVLIVLNISVIMMVASDESGTPGSIAEILLSFVVYGVFIFPIVACMGFWLVRRTRSGERAQRGRYGTLVAIGILTQLCYLPGIVAQQLGNPGGTSQMHMMPDMFIAGFEQGMAKSQLDAAVKTDVRENGELKKDTPEGKKRMEAMLPFEERYHKAEARMKELEEKMALLGQKQKPGFMLLFLLLTVAAVIFTYFWAPWAMYAALDPEEESSSTGQALARGRELARNGGAISIWLVPIVVSIIMAATIAACCLPGIFFGLPLAFAMVPGMYMCLRGEGDAAATPA